MKISFVIPAFNEETAILPCLRSIRAEIERAEMDAEVIVVNNMSTDGTASAAGAIPGVRVVEEPQKGIVWARSRGLAEAQGELVANIDADNVLPPGWLKTVLAEFDRDPRLVCLSGPLVYRDLSWLSRATTKFFYLLGLAAAGLFRIFLRRGSVVQGGNFVFRRRAMLGAGGYRPKEVQFYGEDTAVGRTLEPIGRVKFTFRLPVWSSGRRLAVEGVFHTGVRYAANFIWMTIFGVPYHLHSRDIRPHPTHDRPRKN